VSARTTATTPPRWAARPRAPLLFLKPNTAVIGPGDAIVRPTQSERTDFEGELAVVIGRVAKNVPASAALDYVFGYTIGNDVTARDLQKSDGQWARAKGSTRSARSDRRSRPSSTSDAGARIVTRVDGEVRQDGPISDMVHSVPRSSPTRRRVHAAGGCDPHRHAGRHRPFDAGQTVEVEITGLGTLRNTARNA
jgi:2-keto-4-pentenoate hydratase/2-oxohepta-3-ene-1,7-dioic acid hydratase in catechol pathway